MHPPPPGVSPPRTSPTISPTINARRNSSYYPPVGNFANSQPQFIMPWAVPGTKDNSSLYKTSPPTLTYPAGSRDEDKNNRFVKSMDMYLFTNFQVRAILVGDRPHPFSGYVRLTEYYKQLGQHDWTFDTATTFATLQEIRENGHTDFYMELCELL